LQKWNRLRADCPSLSGREHPARHGRARAREKGGLAVIELSNVAKAFGARQILRDISFTVSAGEVACLIGPSGSGKSTILRTINGLESHDAGRITVDGTLLSDKTLPAIRRKVSMVFQRFNLFPHRTVI